jgi:aspartyl-tRNA(Asn)/glutamyl-tRNA(Gln) amidotransferase subunit C
MLPLVRSGLLANDRVRRRDRVGRVGVDLGAAERRLEAAGADDRDAVERDEMRRSDEHDDVEPAAAQQAVRMCRHRTGIFEAGMRRYERHQIAVHVAGGALEISVDGRRERGCACRIPAAGNGGAPDGCHTYIVEFGMPASFTREQVAAIAALANLELDTSELDLFAQQLGDILAYADQVQLVDTSGVPATASVATGDAADRPDEVAPSLDRREALSNAPDAAVDAGFFKVPRVFG